MQTLIRRVGTQGRIVARGQRVGAPQVGAARGEPASADPRAVAAALKRQYERWGGIADRMLRQEDVSPAMAEAAAGGRRAHREWVEAAFAEQLDARPPPPAPTSSPASIGVCGVELWLVLRRDAASPPRDARNAVAN